MRPSAPAKKALSYALLLGVGCLVGPTDRSFINGDVAPAAFAQSNVIRVSTSAQLQQVLSNTQGGYTVELAPGDYGNLHLRTEQVGPLFTRPVTIRSANPCSPARFHHVYLTGVSNLTLQGLRFENPVFFNRPRADVLPNGRVAHMDLVRTDRVSNITIRDSMFVGTTTQVQGGHHANGYGHGFGWHGLNVRNVVFTNNELTNLDKAVNLGSATDVQLTGNSVHAYRSDAIFLATAKNVSILNNLVADPRPHMLPGGRGDHPDFIQIIGIDGGRIENNYMDLGLHGVASQGIFATGSANNMIVRHNVIATRSANALLFNSLTNSDISNNLVVDAILPPGVGTSAEGHVPVLSVKSNYRNVRLTNNLASRFTGNFDAIAQQAGLVTGNNASLQSNSPQLLNYYHYNATGAAAPASTTARFDRVLLGSVPAGTGPSPSRFGYLSQGTSRGACGGTYTPPPATPPPSAPPPSEEPPPSEPPPPEKGREGGWW